MKKQSILLPYTFNGKDFDHLVKDHTQFAREFLKDEYGIKEEFLDKIIRDFDLIYLLEENKQYLGILSKVFYDEAVEAFEREERGEW